jgi:thioredoxin reductase/ferredoxin
MITDSTLTVGLGAVLVLLFTVPFVLRKRRHEREALEAQERAERYGLHEPVTMHPVVAADACIGTGNCISVCPEGDVLGLRDGQAVAVTPASCIGHGLCERACPVEAIQLVFGSEKRGVQIPRVQANFETNVPGLYVIGELGGMGLIRNAFEQGRQCIEGIAREPKGPHDLLEVLIVGCGPAGLSASLHALHRKLRFRTIEKEDVGGTVRLYPRKKIVMTQPIAVPGFGKLSFREIAKEDLIGVWQDIIGKTDLHVTTGETVRAVTRGADGAFTVESDKGQHRAKRVILAIGRRGVPRKLGVPGENLPKVIYSLREPEEFKGDKVVVVGGGDSAIEAALALADQPGTRVWLSYRGDKFARIKPGNRERIEHAASEGKVKILWSTNLVEIGPDSVTYKNGGPHEKLPNDLVAIFAGGELPTRFLEQCGVQIDVKFGSP